MNRLDVYTERATLLALLATHYPAHLYPVTDPEPGFTMGVCLHLLFGQAAWHVADSDLGLFPPDLPVYDTHYDGHTTEQKYAAIREEAWIRGPRVRYAHPARRLPLDGDAGIEYCEPWLE